MVLQDAHDRAHAGSDRAHTNSGTGTRPIALGRRRGGYGER